MEELVNILKNPFNSGLLTFFGGVLSILGLYHFILYFQQRTQAYLYYSLYVFLLCLSSLRFSEIYLSIHPFFRTFQYFITEVSFVTYFIFAFSFLNMKESSPRWNYVILTSNYVFFGFAVFIQILSLLLDDPNLRVFGYNFFLIYMPLLALIAYYSIFKSPNPLKYYIITGSTILFVSWLFPVTVYQMSLGMENFKIASSIFLFGAVVENFIFSLGLGHKQKLLLDDNKAAHEEIIAQYEENERLRKDVQEKLEENVRLLNIKAEQEEIEKMKANYEKELAELKILALQSQMNPHFIFNSLNSIKLYIINNETENAVYYLNKFSKLIRKILEATREKQISLAEEIETMELYVSIENIRFSSGIDFAIEKDPEIILKNIKLPPLILQPFLENAIWHGLPLIKKEKKLKIKLKKINGTKIKIEIEDNGIGRQKSKDLNSKKLHKKSSLGVNLTHERLRTFYRDYEEDFLFYFEDLKDIDQQPRGTKVNLVLPLK